ELNSEAEWSVIKNVLEQKLKVQAPHPTQSAHWENFYLEWLQELVTRGIPIQLDLYSTTSSHPKDLALKEDPPYIAAVPMLPINKERADQHPLLFKTSSNIYRIPLLKALFPRAHFSWIILQRNPAASINALMDGWLSTAFHSQEVYPDFELKIKGYSDNIPQGSRYWKFDMPPGWQNYIHASLEEVCAFQWYSAAQTIEDFISQLDEPFIRIKYEDLFSASDPIHSGLERNLKQIFDFTQLVPYSHSLWNPKTPVVAVKDPSPGKWKKRQEIILPLIETFSGGKLLHLAHRLDYDTNKILEWP
ncbi:MAG: hypothetical protein KDD35_13325, partial [Bdellovibrionales bacterium]|nr:hypothetical protein [Bdellovibrionales bacterium]